jgi:hypothetical protein
VSVGNLIASLLDMLDLSLIPSKGITVKGHRVEFNEEAARNAIARVRAFLQRTIGVDQP